MFRVGGKAGYGLATADTPIQTTTTSEFRRTRPVSSWWAPKSINGPGPLPLRCIQQDSEHLVADLPERRLKANRPRQCGTETSRSRLASTTFSPMFLSQRQALAILHSRVRACPTGFSLRLVLLSRSLFSARSGSSAPASQCSAAGVRSIAALHKFQFKQDVSPPGEMCLNTLGQSVRPGQLSELAIIRLLSCVYADRHFSTCKNCVCIEVCI